MCHLQTCRPAARWKNRLSSSARAHKHERVHALDSVKPSMRGTSQKSCKPTSTYLESVSWTLSFPRRSPTQLPVPFCLNLSQTSKNCKWLDSATLCKLQLESLYPTSTLANIETSCGAKPHQLWLKSEKGPRSNVKSLARNTSEPALPPGAARAGLQTKLMKGGLES